MSPFLLIALQAAAAEPMPSDFDLKNVPARDRQAAEGGRCAGGDDEIVVCGRRDPDRYRYRPPAARPEWFEEGLPRAKTSLGNGATGGIELEQVGNDDGTVSKRILVRVKTKF